ncbi:MAG TPA: PAS domain S-box protein, partial [Thermoplasmata archaeon]|nr:PAS domain S-box protein [Thermoplasmata archaeon]
GNILYLSPSGREVLGVRSLPVSVTGLLADPDVDASRLLSSESEVSDRTPAFIDVNAPSGTLTLEIYERKVSGERLARELERDGRAPAGPIFLGVARDITRRIEMERQIETYTARLEESAKRAEETLTRQMEEMAFFQGLTMDLARAEAPGEAGEHLLDWAAKWLASGPHALYLVNADTGRYDLIAHRGIDAARAERFAVLHPDILRARDLVEGKVPITFRPRERDVAVLGDDETTLVPLFSGSDLIGVLVTTERPPEGYLLSSLLFHTGIFFERIGTRVESRAREHVLRAIESLGMAALAGVDPERLTSGVLERLSDHWRSDVAILVTGGDGRSVLAVHPSGVLPLEPGSTVDMAGLEPPPDGSVLLKDLEAEGAACPLENLLRGNGVRSVLSVSLRRVEGPTDTVILCRRGGEPFGRAEARGLGEMAAAISLAMARVSDLKRVAHLRITHETVLERAPDGIIVVRDGRVVLANEALTRMLGRNRDALVGIDPVALAAENDRETFAVMLSAAGGPSGSPIEGDIRMIRGDGTSLGLHLVCTSVEHEGGPAVLAFLRHPVVSQEGTAVRAGPVASLRSLFDDATDAVLLLSLEEGGTPGPIDYANRAAGLLLGREANDLQGVSIGDILPGEAMEGITGHLAGLPEDRHATFETEFGTADGERVPVRVEVHLVGDDGARQVLIVAMDLRPIRRLERERDAGRALLEAILGSAGEGIIVMDRDLVIRRLNDSIRLALGGAEEVLTGMPLADLIDESDREQIIALLRDVLEGDLSQGPFRIAMRTADGGRVTFDARAATARAPDTQVVLVLRDTSQEERLRAALEESEARRSEVLEKALDAVLWLDASGAITSANAAAHGTLGRPVEEIVGKGLAECLQPEDRRALEDALKGIPEGESRDVPLRFERPDGETRWTWARFQPAAGGGTLVFLKDVTTWAQETEDVRRRKEEVERELTAVRASVASAVDLLEALDELCLRISRENHITWANTRFLRMAGLRPADLRGMQWSDIVPVIRRGEANAVLETSDTFEFPILVAKGGDLQVRWRAVAAEDGHYLIGTPVLEKEAPPVVGGVVRFRMNTGGELEEMSGDVEGLLGYGAGEALEIPYFFTKVAHPADAERIKKKLLKLIKFREFIPKDEYRVVRKDGRTVHVREHL